MAAEFLTRADLLQNGLTRRSIQTAVRHGELLHVRRDRYLHADTHEEFARAVRVGGRLTCLSLLALLGVFVFDNGHLHVHVHPTSSRLRFARKGRTIFDTARRRVKVHWTNLLEAPGSSCSVHVLDALAHAILCQAPRHAVATVDSALHQGHIVEAQLADLFAALPRRFRALLPMVDGRAESGPESLVRIMARMLGCDIQLQVEFDDIGRVDLLLDGWLVVECDSKQFHASWGAQQRDRHRDLALAAKGYCTIRLTAATIMYQPDEAFAALRGLIESRRG